MAQILEVEIEEAFLRLCYKLKHAPEILQRVLGNLYEMTNHRMLWSPDVIELNKRISDILSQNQMLAVLKQQGLVDPDIFISKTNELAEQLRKLKFEKERLLEAKTDDTLFQTKQIMEVIRELAHKKTVILISHRLANVVDADQILVMKDGVIEEAGTHDELMERKGYYSSLYETQQELERYVKEAV